MMLRKINVAVLVVAMAVLAGCTQIEKEVGQCEGGVANLSDMARAVPDC